MKDSSLSPNAEQERSLLDIPCHYNQSSEKWTTDNENVSELIFLLFLMFKTHLWIFLQDQMWSQFVMCSAQTTPLHRHKTKLPIFGLCLPQVSSLSVAMSPRFQFSPTNIATVVTGQKTVI